MTYTAGGFFVGILIMATITYVLRVAPLLLWGRFRFGGTFRRTLARVPPIVLTAMALATLAPYVIPRADALPQYDRIPAFLIAILAQYRFRSTVLSILIGLASAAALPYLARR